METGHHLDVSHSDGSTWQKARHALNYFLAQLGQAGVASHKKQERHEEFALGLKDERLGEATCSVALSDDHLTIVVKLGDETWRAAAATDAHWRSDQKDRWLSSDQMIAAIKAHLAQEVF